MHPFRENWEVMVKVPFWIKVLRKVLEILGGGKWVINYR